MLKDWIIYHHHHFWPLHAIKIQDVAAKCTLRGTLNYRLYDAVNASRNEQTIFLK